MKPKTNPFLRSALLTAAMLALGTSAQAYNYYWDTTTAGSWADVANWSDNPTAGGTGTVPSPTDSAVFNQSSVNGATVVTMDNDRSILGLTFGNTGSTALTAGGTARTLTLGTGGITLASGAGPVTLGDGTAANNVLLSLTSGQQTWTNNSASNFTINNTAASFTRATGSSLIFTTPGSGRFNMSTTVLPNTNSIIGPWALYNTTGTAAANTAAGYNYAFNNAGTIQAFTGATVSTWDGASALAAKQCRSQL